MRRLMINNVTLRTITYIDWSAPEKLEPNLVMLNKINDLKKRQSPISKERQIFIQHNYTLTPEEMRCRREYLEEWDSRIQEHA